MQMCALMMSSPHNCPCILYITFWTFFLLKHVNHVPISKYIRANIILHLFRVDVRQVLLSQHSWNKVWDFSAFLWTKLMETWEAITIINSLNCIIHIDCSRNISLKITEIHNFISSLFLSDLHKFFTVLFEIVNSFYWLNLILDRISPLIIYMFLISWDEGVDI